jgi:hypothetical protein
VKLLNIPERSTTPAFTSLSSKTSIENPAIEQKTEQFMSGQINNELWSHAQNIKIVFQWVSTDGFLPHLNYTLFKSRPINVIKKFKLKSGFCVNEWKKSFSFASDQFNDETFDGHQKRFKVNAAVVFLRKAIL